MILVMNNKNPLQPVTKDQLKCLSRADLVELLLGEQKVRLQIEENVTTLKDSLIELGDKYVRIKNRLFMPSSEKLKPKDPVCSSKPKPDKPKKKKHQKPSDRYPNIPIIQQDVELETPPLCSCCGEAMADSGLCETTEHLTIEPRKYFIVQQKAHKYRCNSCHGTMVNTPTPPRIKSGSSYSDEMIIDVALSKYCDLIPIDRYAAMAARQGLKGLPPHSLIELTHHLADFLLPIYEGIKREVLDSVVLHADETPHKMLEGDKKKNWRLWGFSNHLAAYFEIHDSRSGDVASAILNEANCEYLVTDVFSGYAKAVRLANECRQHPDQPKIKNCYCNAHSRRYFSEIHGDSREDLLQIYQQIYSIESKLNDLPIDQKTLGRQEMLAHFDKLRKWSVNWQESYSSRSSEARAAGYFLRNFEGLTRFISDGRIPIDNNPQERLLRSPVVGRKTWYGTHSKRGAKTAAVLFTIVESCKLNKVNPRTYFSDVTNALHKTDALYTPATYKLKTP